MGEPFYYETNVNDILFSDKEFSPDEARLSKALGNLFPAYKEVIDLTKTFDHESKYYSKTIGWQLKIVRKGKVLCYLTPLSRSFKISFAVREHEKEVLLDSNLPSKIKKELRSAKKYPEGYPLRLLVSRTSEMRVVRLILKVLLDWR